jgi:nicotinamide-nucleotide amidase
MFAQDIQQKAAAVIAAAARRGWTVATAESCTGGLVAGSLTGVAGSSAVVDRGFVTYSNAAKSEMIGVPGDLIQTHGAVSEAVARAMAAGARDTAGTTVAVSITGIAGPGGGSADKPVGLVHFACAGPDGLVHTVHRFGDIGRDAVRMESIRVALGLLLDACEAQ